MSTRWEPIHGHSALPSRSKAPTLTAGSQKRLNGIAVEDFSRPAPAFESSKSDAGLFSFGFGSESIPTMDLKARKSEIRREVVARIMAMDPGDRAAQERALALRFEGLPGLDRAGTVLLYASAFPEELETRPMLLRAAELGKRVVLPKVDRRSRSLRLFEVADLDRDLVIGHRGIPEPRPGYPEVEPAAVDWVLVPGLAFDDRGHRLGRGAGHYDRLLPRLRPEVPRWALVLEAQWVEDLPIEPHDQPLDGVADFRRLVTGDRPPAITR